MSKTKEVKKKMSKKTRVLLIAVAAVLALSLLGGVLFSILTYSPTVLRYGGATLGEDAYSYWFACMKYQLMIQNRNLGIEDSYAFWDKTAENGKTYEELFKTAADREIALRFIAASLFDALGAGLGERYYEAIATALADMETYSYGENVYDVISEKYGASQRELKRVALYEAKYHALRYALFGTDLSGIYDVKYRASLSAFYGEYYSLYNVIYLSDAKNAEKQAELAAQLDGMDEESFEAFEKAYSETPVTENYPDGIYIFRKADYTSAFSEELLTAMGSLGEVGDTAVARDKNDQGTYYVMRYALPVEPYLSEDEKIAFSLSGFAEYASSYLYLNELEACLEECEWVEEISSLYTIGRTVKAVDYNILRYLILD